MANQSIRIRTTPGQPKNIRVKVEQDFDFLEVLSLKISQEDLYQTFCSNYGVVVGRVIVNRGFGVSNAKISVFVPITSEDEKNLLIKDLYPFKTPYQKNNGVRYNLLLSKTTCGLNAAVGTFPLKEDVLDNDLVLEVFDKYYKYTTKTNSAGDFMLFGVPVGQRTIHMDVDLSDSGASSIRPYDMIADGYSEKLFKSKTEFKTSVNLDILPQIKSGNIGVDVIPFWGDPESCEIGITRVDFDTNFDVKTSSLFFGSIFTDSGKMAMNKGCNPRNDQGEQDNLKTGSGTIRMIRVSDYDQLEWYNNNTIKPVGLEKFSIDGDDLIDTDGTFTFVLPLNIGHVITDEFGDIVPSPDPSIGVATKGMYRFAMKFNESNQNPKFKTATILFPSLGENFGGTIGMVDTGVITDANGTQDQRFTDEICEYNTSFSPIPGCGSNFYDRSNIKLDFHTFEWKQIYTIAHYIKKYKRAGSRFNFIGLKNTDVSGESTQFPFNNAIWKFDIIYYIIALFIDFKTFFIKLLLVLITFCIRICMRLTFYWRWDGPTIGVGKSSWSLGFTINLTLIDIGFQICPFAWLGKSLGTFNLPCEGAPQNDEYEVPPNGDWLFCNPQACPNGNVTCTVNCSGGDYNFQNTNFWKFGITTSNVGNINNLQNPCINLLEDWKCCAKLNAAENRNVIRRVFNDAWVFGTAYLFQFKYKRKIKKSTGKVKKEKFCGPGSDHLRGDNYKKNQCCIDTAGGSCHKCLLRGPGLTQVRSGFNVYHDTNHNSATNSSKTGASDLDEIIYCNALMSTKIVSLGRTELCEETIEEIETATLANQGLQQYTQSPSFYTGTFFENGWDPEIWVDNLKESSYEDPRDVILYCAKAFTNPRCNLNQLFHGGGITGYPCHEFELKDNPFFFIKEISKIYTDVGITNEFPNEDEFGGESFTGYGGLNNPYMDFTNDPPVFGGFIVDAASANRFSPCGRTGGGSECVSYNPTNPLVGRWDQTNSPPPNLSPEDAYSDSWDRYVSQGNRNNVNSRSNIPYYYFGTSPGKTAINRLRKEFFIKK
jgi:hypothetical protein